MTRQTARHLGVAISPHLFRDCAATSIALDDPAHVLITKEGLGHASIRISQRVYNQAQTHEAATAWQRDLRRRRRTPTPIRRLP